MSHEHLVPPGVDPNDAALLQRAYALRDQDEGQVLYTEWAETYDRTMVDGLGYISPQRLVDVFTRHVTWRDGAVLDLGCGTGLVGRDLHGRGFTTLDGLDLSEPMMSEAARSGAYRRFVVGDLNATLPIETGSYAAMVCNGTFTSGHVGAGCLPEVLRLIEPGGFFACAVHNSVWDALGFSAEFADLTGRGVLEELDVIESPYYLSSPGPDGRLCVFRTT